MRPKGVSLTQLTQHIRRKSGPKTYPEGAFEALLVIAVDWCKYLQELQDALLIVEIGYLLERLLNQLTKSFCLKRNKKGERKGSKNNYIRKIGRLFKQKIFSWGQNVEEA